MTSGETDLLSDAGTAGKTASRKGKNSEKTIGQTLSGAAVFGKGLSLRVRKRFRKGRVSAENTPEATENNGILLWVERFLSILLTAERL